MTDLNKKQSFWAEQLPSFKENYIYSAQLEAVEFNYETGNFDALTKDATGFDLEDILEAYHSVNTGWAMWLRAMSQEKAKAQAVPEGCVVVPREPTKEMLKAGIHNYLHQDSIKEKDGSTSISFKFIYQAMIEASVSGAEQ
ncbi:hypothetical protein [Acinetobacter baumannii]|uniref:hypothetical protein n=1 Tax=Acinetobacter baumannii TaxID=470 RepID=UPI0038923CE1